MVLHNVNHFRSDWHSYNVKRKIAGLSPLSKELFEERQRHLKAAETEGKKQEKLYCEICHKSFVSKNSFDQHERSKRHLQGLKKYQDDFQNAPEEEKEESQVEKVTKGHTEPFTPEEYEFEPSRCLFCRLESDTFDANLEHMAAVHCFFIPDHDSVIDLEGLIDYLGQKISIGCVCVGCNHGFKSPAATRDHMLSKGHTRMAYSTEEDYEEFEEFYDYTEANENPGVTLQATATGELQLPDGRILGNREYMRYYKQNFSSEGEKRESILNKLLLENGGQGKKPMALVAYEAQKSELTSKRDDVERNGNRF